MLAQSLSRTFAQLPDPKFRNTLLKSLALTLVLFTLVIMAALQLLPDDGFFSPDSFWFEWMADALNWLIGASAVLTMLAILVFTFSQVSTLISSFFLDDVADAVERRFYPDAPASRDVGVGEAVGVSLKFLGVTLALNIVVLPLYILALIFPPLFLFIFYGLNGYLLSREYFELVSLRQMDPKASARLRKAHRGTVFVAGVVIAFAVTIPIVNLAVPILATAFMVHVLHGLQAKEAARGVATA